MNPTPPHPGETRASRDPVFVLVFDKLPAFDIGQIADGIRANEPLQQDVTYTLEGECDSGFSARVMFDDHQIHLVGLSAPLPKPVFEQAVNGSKFYPKLTSEMANQQAHITCFYEGNSGNPSEQMIALEKMARAFLPMGVLGQLDTGAWTCRPRMLMEKFTIKLLRGTLEGEPHMLSLGFVKIIKEDGIWFCTKGQHRFGLPDFAWLGDIKEAQAIYDSFGKLFLQFRESGKRPQPGDTAILDGNLCVRFREVYECADWLNGPGGCVVIERTDEGEARTGGPTGAGVLHENRDQVVFIKDGDEAMNLAIQLARNSMDHFWEVFANPQNREEGFSLKVRVSDKYGTEQFWVGDIEQKGDQLSGRINNDPNVVKTVKSGQRVPVPLEEITDWLYMRNRKMVGNFTARALVRTMPPAEAAKYHAMMSDFFPLKLNCTCGQHYTFEVEAPNGQMPYAIACPACNADGTAAANSLLAIIIHGAVTEAAAPKPPGALSLSRGTTSGTPPPVQTRTATASAPPARGNTKKILMRVGLAIGGLALVLGLGVALLIHHFSPSRHASPFPSPPAMPPGINSSTPSHPPGIYEGAPIFFKQRHATFKDLQDNEYNDVVLTVANSRGLSYYKIGGRGGMIPYTNLPTEFLIDLGVRTNWTGVLK